MTDKLKDAWWAMMRDKYETDNDGVRAIMAERQRKSMKSPKRAFGHRAGFNAMTKEQLQEVSRKGVEARQNKTTEKTN